MMKALVLIALPGIALAGCGSDVSPATPPMPAIDGGDASQLPPPQPAPSAIDVAWRMWVPVASEGSPALCDLDGDGGGDGALELVAPLAGSVALSQTMVVVADARSGEIRWSGGQGLHPYGTPACVQVDGTGPEDVLVTGRAGDVVALDGATGSELWWLSALNPEVLTTPTGPGFVSSVALDRSRAVAATTLGGDRELGQPGRLIVFRPDGAVVATLDAPDGAESYGSPAWTTDEQSRPIVAFPTGGETVAGRVYLLRYDEPSSLTMVGSLASACDTGGFVASPHFADLDQDGRAELIAADYCGFVHVGSGDGAVRWARSVGGYVTANPVSAELDADGHLDVVVATTNFNPTRGATEPVASQIAGLRGQDGTVLWTRDYPGAVFASPGVLDVDGDGADDVVIVVAGGVSGDEPQLLRGGLLILSGRDGTVLASLPGVASAGTPVGDDVDGDGMLDLFVADQPASAGGGSLLRLSLPGARWSPSAAFMGFRGHPIPTGAR